MALVAAVRGWWRGRGRISRRASSGTRVAIPPAVDAPAHVLRALRELDDRLDLFILPYGEVWLLQQQEDKPRMREAADTLAHLRKMDLVDGPEYALQLQAQGFALLSIESYLHGTSAGYMVECASKIIRMTEGDVRAVMRERYAESASIRAAERRAKTISERINATARHDHAWAYRGRRNFSRQTLRGR